MLASAEELKKLNTILELQPETEERPVVCIFSEPSSTKTRVPNLHLCCSKYIYFRDQRPWHCLRGPWEGTNSQIIHSALNMKLVLSSRSFFNPACRNCCSSFPSPFLVQRPLSWISIWHDHHFRFLYRHSYQHFYRLSRTVSALCTPDNGVLLKGCPGQPPTFSSWQPPLYLGSK